ncbi:LPXTG cell wall anchor domain-containing protein [Streptacidiphilus sp. EB129]|uniref:DUF7927 domain-containing protein n=1 Tax=Streptacidiphilus sp. EB129 TaxID=3156262 RepID=UPI0035168514
MVPWIVCAVGLGLTGAGPVPDTSPSAGSSSDATAVTAPADTTRTASTPAAAAPSADSPSAGAGSTSATADTSTAQAPAVQAPAADVPAAQAPAVQAPAAQAPAAQAPAATPSGSTASTPSTSSAATTTTAPAAKPATAKPGTDGVTPCPTGCQIQISKTADRSYYLPGQTVHYTVTVTDIGTDPCPPATVTDDISGDLADSVYNHDAATASGSTSYNQPKLVWTTGTLTPGTPVTMTYSVTADSPDNGPMRLIDAVTAPNSNCLTGTEEGCHVELDSPSWVVTKSENRDDVEPGNRINYTITAHNTGTVDFTGVRQAGLEDDMSLIVKDSVYDADATASSGTITVNKPFVQWRGDLPAGASVTIHLSITAEALPPNTSVLENIVRALYPHHGGTDLSNPLPPQRTALTRSMGLERPMAQLLARTFAGSETRSLRGGSTSTVPLIDACTVNPVTDSCDVTADEPKLIVKKSADRGHAVPGEVITYRVSFANIGDNDFPAGELPVVTDDLSKVLDKASFIAGSLTSTVPSASFDPAHQQIVWSGQLLAGQHAYFQYQVMVHKPFHGDGTLDNLVIAPKSNCQAGSKDAACRVHIPVLQRFFHHLGRLASTGAAVTPAATLGGGLLLSGAGLVLYRRRLRRS